MTSAGLKSAWQGFGCRVELHSYLTNIGPHNIKFGMLACCMSKIRYLARSGSFRKVGYSLEPNLHKITDF